MHISTRWLSRAEICIEMVQLTLRLAMENLVGFQNDRLKYAFEQCVFVDFNVELELQRLEGLVCRA